MNVLTVPGLSLSLNICQSTAIPFMTYIVLCIRSRRFIALSDISKK